MSDEDKIDEYLIKDALERKNKHAFDTLVLKYQYRLFKIIARHISDPNEVLDVAQEVFIKAYNSLHTFRGESSFYTWLYRIAINTAKNYSIANWRRSGEINFELRELDQYINKKNVGDYNPPEQKLLDEEISDLILKLISVLPAELKNTLILREIDDLTYDEIAAVMDCPVGTVRSRIYRAREALGKGVDPEL
jgi:RNA polymerase sigma-70 factor, ECF subfamily